MNVVSVQCELIELHSYQLHVFNDMVLLAEELCKIRLHLRIFFRDRLKAIEYFANWSVYFTTTVHYLQDRHVLYHHLV